MCLVVEIKEKLTANKDIIVYKIVRKEGKRLATPFMNVSVKVGKEYSSSLRKLEDIVDIGIHSFRSKKEALGYAEYFSKYFLSGREVICLVECSIPKGSEYYKGHFPSCVGHYQCVASNKIKYIKIITEDVPNSREK